MASTTARGRARRHGRQSRRTPEGRMSLGQHLIELRNRLFKAVIAVARRRGRRLVPHPVRARLAAGTGDRARQGRRAHGRAELPDDHGRVRPPAADRDHDRHRHRQPGVALPDLGVHRPGAVRREKQYVFGLPRHRDPAVLRGLLVRLVRPAARRRHPRQLRVRARTPRSSTRRPTTTSSSSSSSRSASRSCCRCSWCC